MATLTIKNKYQVTLGKLVKESKEQGAIPDVIDINGREAWDILNEIRLVGSGGFAVEPNGKFDPQFMLRNSKEPFDQQTAEDLVTRWWKKEFQMVFKYEEERIPLVVKNDRKKVVKAVTHVKMNPTTTEKIDKPVDTGDNTPTED